MRETISLTHLVIGALAIIVLAFGFWTWGGSGPKRSEALHPELKTEMHFEIDGTFSSQPGDAQCDSRTQAICKLDEGTPFTLHIVPSVIPAGGYYSWQAQIEYGSLLYKPAPTSCSSKPIDCPEVKWDQSDIVVRAPAAPTGKEGQVGFAAASSSLCPCPLSFQTTAFVNLQFNCARNDQAGQGHGNLVRLVDFNESPSGAQYVSADHAIETVNVPNVSDLSIECVVPLPKQPDPGDTDLDGCSDQAENGPNGRFGGQRNYLYFWDFYDVWTPRPGDSESWERNSVITIFDVLFTASRFGAGPVLSKTDALAQALVPPTDTTSYHPAYDRSINVGPNPWDLGPPDGVITVVHDILGVAVQFGHNCT